jgi:hypothetical protein
MILEFTNFKIEFLFWLSFKQTLILKVENAVSLKQTCFKSKEVNNNWDSEKTFFVANPSLLKEVSSRVWKKLFIDRVFKVEATIGKIR